MKPPRGLSKAEADLWARVAATVKPLEPRRKAPPQPLVAAPPAPVVATPPKRVKGRVPAPLPVKAPPQATLPPAQHGLDSHWERRLARTSTAPDLTLDLHGCNLAQAHARLDHGLVQAKAMGARLVLLVTGRPRPAPAADRGETRGAIRAHVLDWLAAGPHSSDIAAVRPAPRRHGGDGALYLVIKRAR